MTDLTGTIILVSLISFYVGHYFGWTKGYRDGKDGKDEA